jgi:hypothetical protein
MTFTSDLVLEKQIGRGGYGKVYKGTWRNSPCAVKVRAWVVKAAASSPHLLVVYPGRLGLPCWLFISSLSPPIQPHLINTHNARYAPTGDELQPRRRRGRL